MNTRPQLNPLLIQPQLNCDCLRLLRNAYWMNQCWRSVSLVHLLRGNSSRRWRSGLSGFFWCDLVTLNKYHTRLRSRMKAADAAHMSKFRRDWKDHDMLESSWSILNHLESCLPSFIITSYYLAFLFGTSQNCCRMPCWLFKNTVLRAAKAMEPVEARGSSEGLGDPTWIMDIGWHRHQMILVTWDSDRNW